VDDGGGHTLQLFIIGIASQIKYIMELISTDD
jgi:hypothetical protein